MSPRVGQRERSKFRVVCQGGAEKITLRAEAKDKYEAFEQVTVFLRSKGFDYRVVLIEPS
ncbi:MAG TPA: hypothetical protein VF570_10885 [Pyrinomonadaceae bacterium]